MADMEEKKSNAVQNRNNGKKAQDNPQKGQKRGNLNNLKGHGFHERTAEEQRQLAVMGGKASGEARRKKKSIREVFDVLLSSPANAALVDKVLSGEPVDLPGDATLYDLMGVKMILEALSGDVAAFNSVRDSAGDKPTDKVEGAVSVMTERDKVVMERIAKRMQEKTGSVSVDSGQKNE